MAYDRNEYLLENYGTTLARYNEMDAEQGHRCKCCGQVPTGKPLHVDHCHKIAKLKIKVRLEIDGVWRAVVVSFGQWFEATSRSEARELAHRWLLAKSVRGLLCWRCNEGMRSFKNRPDVMRNAAQYMDDFAARMVNTDGKQLEMSDLR